MSYAGNLCKIEKPRGSTVRDWKKRGRIRKETAKGQSGRQSGEFGFKGII